MAGVTLTGRSASPGAALAPAFVMEERPVSEAVAPPKGTPQEEAARASAALEATETALYELSDKVAADTGEEEAAIFAAHADFAADPELAGRVSRSTADGNSAEVAVREAFGSFRELLASSTDEYLAARASDLDDVRDQVLARLAGVSSAAVPETRSVVVARDLTPSQTARIPRALLAGIACETGSPTSHAAILARALGIPAVMGVTGLVGTVTTGTALALDGDAGAVVVDPDAEQRTATEARIAADAGSAARLAGLAGERGQTADGRHIELAANVNGPDALGEVAEYGAEGSGLVRTEFLFLGASEPPSVDEQTAYYQRVLQAFPGQRVVIRTLDIGADKPVPYIQRTEENPALGLRGLRLGLHMRELLVDQIRALLRAGATAGEGAGRLAVMFPMVSKPDELDEVLAVIDEVRAEEGLERPEIGVMIEVPSAALAARRMAARVDFLSLGTNDLLQYLFAADRLLADVAYLPDLLDPDVLRLIGDIATAAHAEGAWAGVCGESAADPVNAVALVGLGIDELSMTPRSIPRIKDTLRGLTSDAMADAARAAVAADDAAGARAALERVLAG